MSVSNDKTRLYLSGSYSLKVLQQHIKNENSQANESSKYPIFESKPKHIRKSVNVIDQINNHLNSKNYMMVSPNRPKRLSSEKQIKRPEIKRYMPPSKRADISFISDTSACESTAPEIVCTTNDLTDVSSTSLVSQKNIQNQMDNDDKSINEKVPDKNLKALLIIKEEKITREFKDNHTTSEKLPISNYIINYSTQKNNQLNATLENQSDMMASVPTIRQTNESISTLISPTSTIPTMLLVKDALNCEKRITLAPQQSPTKSSVSRHDQGHNLYIPPGAQRSLSFSEENNYRPKNSPNDLFPSSHHNPSYNTQLYASNRLYDPFRDLNRQNQACMLPQSHGYNAEVNRRPVSPIVYRHQEDGGRCFDNVYYPTPLQRPLQTHAFDGYTRTTNYLSREPPPHPSTRLDDAINYGICDSLNQRLHQQQQQQIEYSPSRFNKRGDVKILRKEVNNLLGDLRIGDSGNGGSRGQRSRVNSTKTSEQSYSQYFGEEDVSDSNTNIKLDRVIEVSGFPVEFKTVDLTNILTSTGDADMDILWVDDDHALAAFTTAHYASEALQLNHPLVKCKPYEQACAKSKAKAQKNLDFVFTNMTSNRSRPLTTVVVARRFIENHLGVKCNVSSETRLKEAHTLKEAAALGKKKIAAEKKKIDPWDE